MCFHSSHFEASGKQDLSENHFYFMLLGELCKDIDNSKAKENYQLAYSLAKTNSDKVLIQKNIDNL